MLDLLYAQINIVGIILLLLLLNNMKKNSYKDKPLDQQLFNNLLIMNILIFTFDSGMWLVDGDHFVGAKVINYIVTLLYYISNPLICFLWLMYTDFKIHESRIGLKKRVGFYMIPCIVSTILSIVSVYTGWLFQIDEKNNYVRGPYFWIMALFALFYLLNQPSLENKKISCFVTQHFAKPWMGGNRAVKQISKLVYNKNGSVVRSDIINWSNVKREEQISCLISRFSS